MMDQFSVVATENEVTPKISSSGDKQLPAAIFYPTPRVHPWLEVKG
ncbi:hypothetical protein I8751_21160 [Nostocaceae cyanobacterium CENA357]|uniref:Uncharacterized protein n=1 Tax=Atlanticothrix silvestris CENA357 TaxID=1725252 RepID=A0A8J7HM67_9CYAN|nr:hypothetical protein [Atlanticothrix silvestris]MBH8554815.1 hypothetical protein [Atlanticothrix silvestris CENA357]